MSATPAGVPAVAVKLVDPLGKKLNPAARRAEPVVAAACCEPLSPATQDLDLLGRQVRLRGPASVQPTGQASDNTFNF